MFTHSLSPKQRKKEKHTNPSDTFNITLPDTYPPIFTISTINSIKPYSLNSVLFNDTTPYIYPRGFKFWLDFSRPLRRGHYKPHPTPPHVYKAPQLSPHILIVHKAHHFRYPNPTQKGYPKAPIRTLK